MMSDPAQRGEFVDMLALARTAVRSLWVLPLLVGAMLGLAALYLNLTTYLYAASLQVTPPEQGGAKLPSSVSGLGSLVGFDLGLGGSGDFEVFPEAVLSKGVAEILARDEVLMRGMFPEQWDEATGEWREPRSTIRATAEAVKRVLGVPSRPWERPAAFDVRTHLEKALEVAPDRKKDIITLRYEHRDPEFAGLLLQRVARAADDFLRARSLARANDYVAYLQDRLREAEVAEYRLFLSQALVNYESKRMMARASAPFAAEPFGPPLVSKRPTSPKPLVVLALAVVMGTILWGLLVLVRFVRSDRGTVGKVEGSSA